MPYCFMDYLPPTDDRDSQPDCPDEVAFLLLADLPTLEWGIFDVNANDAWSPKTPVTDKLANLIESAKRYPPALGLAREEMGQVFGDHCPDQFEFAGAYATALQTHLARQHEAPYVLAKALRGEPGHLTEGEWYWVLEIAGSPAVATWISEHFQIHKNDIGDFDLTGDQLKQLGFSA